MANDLFIGGAGSVAFAADLGFAERPPGMQDGYPDFAKQRRDVESRLLSFFEEAGCQPVTSGLFEYVDTLLRARSSEAARDWIQLFDGGGNAIALRPEMTPSIARMAAPRVASGRVPIRWCYCERVYRRTSDPASLSWASGKAAESTQVGVEWIGEPASVATDAALLTWLHDAATRAGIAEHKIVVSHARFVPKLLQALGFPRDVSLQLLQCLTTGDYVLFRQTVDRAATECGDILTRLLRWSPERKGLQRGAINREQSARELNDLLHAAPDREAAAEVVHAWGYLCELADALAAAGLAPHCTTFDLTLHRDMDYYTGIVFEAFAHGVGAPIALGGRYDELLAQFGAPAAAIGFTFEVERVLAVLEATAKSGRDA
ncbi:Histidine--tRNA ligase [Alicyclobacillus hesperidum URH17-3-68]|uniref:ATP phosphoribosyltransferase regulatory subunit n=1 Tax=Alicyclobacillus hesperidum TaxID=89784 RepID=A0A1H2RWJ7_9BACL|nr:ATP phosphoribosyltransferase regulatory subunit [Alicyclobacillus hesperidum]EJY55357.1 Histidine--tRNA ligase [Alicyclobacillus hesperidum URH17-3-68]SDW22979.1 ATP phosphoribosyltransferase regulatory subunit [Alicyclobacillus hesperidum]